MDPAWVDPDFEELPAHLAFCIDVTRNAAPGLNSLGGSRGRPVAPTGQWCQFLACLSNSVGRSPINTPAHSRRPLQRRHLQPGTTMPNVSSYLHMTLIASLATFAAAADSTVDNLTVNATATISGKLTSPELFTLTKTFTGAANTRWQVAVEGIGSHFTGTIIVRSRRTTDDAAALLGFVGIYDVAVSILGTNDRCELLNRRDSPGATGQSCDLCWDAAGNRLTVDMLNTSATAYDWQIEFIGPRAGAAIDKGVLTTAPAGTALSPSTAILQSAALRLNDGTAAAPSLTYASDTNTGLLRPGTDQLGIATNGAERLRVYADGGIQHGGTLAATSPGAGVMKLATTTDSISSTSGALVVAGGVGIDKSLNVTGAISQLNSLGIRLKGIGSYVGYNCYYNAGWKSTQPNTGGVAVYGNNGKFTVSTGTGPATADALITDFVERLTVDKNLAQFNVPLQAQAVSGKCAVGTNAATFIATTPGLANGERSAYSFDATFQNFPTDVGPRRTADIIAGFNGGIWGTEYLAFAVGASNDTRVVTTERMRINAAGQLLIGSSSGSPAPGSSATDLLQVKGGIYARKVTVEAATGWADTVFAADYRLPPLEEVAAHIAEKKHLPGIPSEAEIAAKGIDTADMLKRQMAKIEELTLYVISLNRDLAYARSTADAKTATAVAAANEEIAVLRARLERLEAIFLEKK